MRFARSYVGPRKRAVRASTVSSLKMHFTLGHLHWVLWASFPEWSPKRKQVLLSPIFEGILRIPSLPSRRREGTLRPMLETAGAFLSVLRSRGRTVSRMTVPISMHSSHNRQNIIRRTVARVCTALRSFLRFLRSTGRLERDLAPASWLLAFAWQSGRHALFHGQT